MKSKINYILVSFTLLIGIGLLFIFFTRTPIYNQVNDSVYHYNLDTIEGDQKLLVDYSGQVILIVNIASRCGYANQLKDFEFLYNKYKDKKFIVLAVPSNDFFQEPLSENELKLFCDTTFNITFPLFSKIHVRGKNIHPLFLFLTQSNAQFKGPVTWNFNKFLIF